MGEWVSCRVYELHAGVEMLCSLAWERGGLLGGRLSGSGSGSGSRSGCGCGCGYGCGWVWVGRAVGRGVVIDDQRWDGIGWLLARRGLSGCSVRGVVCASVE